MLPVSNNSLQNYNYSPELLVERGEEESPSNTLPDEMVLHIFSFLPPRDLEAAACICKRWSRIAEDKDLATKEVRNFCFGKRKWNTYFGDVGEEPLLPSKINGILNGPCPFWSGKRVKETHILVLIPGQVNGKAFTLDLLEELIQNPKLGHKTKYSYYYWATQEKHGGKSSPSHWALMTKDVIPNSRNKAYVEQQALIKGPYTVSGVLEMVTGIMMHHVKGGERLYMDSPETYTRCLEQVSINQYRVVVGSFGSSGLSVHYLHNLGDGRYGDYGLGVLRKL